jgi:O-antigen/teichoic acid export membrane protein
MMALLTRRRLMRLSGFASTQVVVQAIGFAAGILLVRCLDQSQYGYYTLAVGMMGVAGTLGDLGLASAVMAIGGRLVGRRRALGQLVGDANKLQRHVAWLALAVLAPCCAMLLVRQHAGPWQVAALTALMAMAALLNVRAGIALSVTRLLGQVEVQQKLDLGINLLKLGVLMLAAWVALDATVAMLVNLGVAAGYLLLLRRHVAAEVEVPAAPAGEHAAALRGLLWKQGPNSVYFVLSGQIAIWLIGFFGSAERVAEVGALGRLGVLFTVIGTVTAAFILPYFARRDEPAELASGFLGVNGFFAAMLAALVVLSIEFPAAILWVLGHRYANLRGELVWMVAAATLAAWGGAVYSIGCARGWVMPVGVSMATGVAAIALAASTVDVASVRGSFMINMAVALAGTVTAIVYFAWQLRLHTRLRAATP